MTTEHERILELVSSGKLTPADADRLLRQAEGEPRRSLVAWLLDPIDRLGTRRALLVGATAVGLGALLGFLGVRFDGALDMHQGGAPVPLRWVLADAVVAWPLTALVFWVVSLTFARQGRWVDHLAAVGLARVPAVLGAAGVAALVAIWPLPRDPAQMESTAGVVLIALLSIPVVVWQIAWLYRGFRTASGLRGARCAIAAVTAILGAEVLSKLVLFLVA